jgi:hypothetical protein
MQPINIDRQYRIIIAGKAADVIPIRKNIPLFYFDKFGHPTETHPK